MTQRYLVRRGLQVVPTVTGILVLLFLLVHAVPGDPVLALAGEHGDAAYYADIRRHFGLDRPLPERFFTYVGRVLSGDLGMSYIQGRPVAEIVGERLPPTLLLTGTALVLSSVIGLAVGAYGALHPGRPGDVLANVLSLVLYAAPVFWVGQMAVLLLGLGLGWFPVFGMRSPRPTSGLAATFLDTAHHLLLPALVLATQQIAGTARVARAALLNELGKDYVRTARAKGLPRRVVLVRHALRLALLPVITLIGGRVGHLLAGAVIVETIFGWPGLGTLLVDSLQNRDTPVVMGIFLVVALTVVLANLVTDFFYGTLDPRVQYG